LASISTESVWPVSLKRQIRIAVLVDPRALGKTGRVVLFSTEVDLAKFSSITQRAFTLNLSSEVQNNFPVSVMVNPAIPKNSIFTLMPL
jgi:hypothetical protein